MLHISDFCGCRQEFYRDDFCGCNEEFYTIDEFSYVIQSLKGLKTLELEGRQTKRYLDVMVNNIQIEYMKQIKRITITQGHYGDTEERHFELEYKLRETITNLDAFPASYRQLRGLNPDYLTEFKSLTHVQIINSLSEGIDFITILRLCPKLQSLNLTQFYATPPIHPSKKLMVYNNLKRLYLNLPKFPRHYVTYITSCIPPTIDHFRLIVRNDEKNWIFPALRKQGWLTNFSRT
jgi:hypothetical protein